jgi:hypothetical protein
VQLDAYTVPTPLNPILYVGMAEHTHYYWEGRKKPLEAEEDEEHE